MANVMQLLPCEIDRGNISALHEREARGAKYGIDHHGLICPGLHLSGNLWRLV